MKNKFKAAMIEVDDRLRKLREHLNFALEVRNKPIYDDALRKIYALEIARDFADRRQHTECQSLLADLLMFKIRRN